MSTFSILGIAGSLRRRSYNRGLVRAAQEVAPSGIEVSTFDLRSVPLYDGDLEVQGIPPAVQELKDRIQAADALLLATPEYNYSFSGVLKNAIDWASRPPTNSVLRHKPIAIVGASPGRSGTIRAQLALRQVFVFTESFVLLKPELLVSHAGDFFDQEGNLTDQATRDRLQTVLTSLADWAHRVGPRS